MKKFLLDTNTCIRFINGRSPELLAKLSTIPASDIAICSVVKAEMFYGAARSTSPDQTLAKQLHFLNQFVSLPFDDAAATYYGQIRAELARNGTPIGPNDLMIAAIGLASNLVVVTHNIREFGRVPRLSVEDWEI